MLSDAYYEDERLLDDMDDKDDEEEKTPYWDIFLDEPPEDENGSSDIGKTTLMLLRIAKVLLSIFLFIMVLGGGVISKGTMLFMTSQIRKNPTLEYCSKDLNGEPGSRFVAQLPDEERVAWVWVLFFSILVPEIMVFLRSIRILLFKPTSWSRPRIQDLAVVFVAETCSIVGVAMLAFSVLPDLDVLKGVMLTNCLCLIPAIFSLLNNAFPDVHKEINVKKEQQWSKDVTEVKEMKSYNDVTNGSQNKFIHKTSFFSLNTKYLLQIIMGVFAVVCQLSGFIVWPLVHLDTPSLWLIIPAIALTSCTWWENYVTKKSSIGIVRSLARVKTRLKRSRYPIYSIISLWKMVCLFGTMLLIWFARGESVPGLFNMFYQSFDQHDIPVCKWPDCTEKISILSVHSAPWLLLIQVCTAYVAYITGKCACRVLVQGFSYTLPVTITVPVTLSILIVLCLLKMEDPCYFYPTIPGYLFFRLPPNEFFGNFVGQQHAWIWLFWLGSQVWVTLHIWYPKSQRLAPTDQIFVSPMYCGILLDQTLALNRRIDDQPPEVHYKKKTMEEPEVQLRRSFNEEPWPEADDAIPRVKACATMWHETREEMIEMLKSVIRMDEDQCARRVVRDIMSDTMKDPVRLNKDYYEYETHIFFDDAFVSETPKTAESGMINIYVRDLLRTVDEAASHVHQMKLQLDAPTVIGTPYGGRLEWILPGKTKLIVHLKDSAKIRHKKRWSQVMYMYYFLGYKLLQLNVPDRRKDVIAQNTYLLALDGDIDFRPPAVLMLVDLMKKNRNLGAACGRIHPVGAGAMAWYQKFEYAVGHWLQKATEHVIGCVLCSPGCFSLFRGSVLMDTNVMRKYTTTSEEARHYVQYDQGEDRWLCTLILQRGYRVEYCAASDSYTHCPEKFDEFYNQRRRWVPSTMANIFDLLGDSKKVVKVNDNISNMYIAYQILLMVGSILGPGTILLMLVGSFVTVFGISISTSMLINVIPIIIYMLICYFAKSKIQVTVAMIYSIVYVLLMVAVLVGIMVQISEDGPLAPTSLFFFIVTAQFIITAMLHPLEIDCLPCGIIYYITVPSMYLLLIVYSLFNLNNVSWGTREVAKPPEQIAQEKEALNQPVVSNKKEGRIARFLNSLRSTSSKHEDEGSFEFSFAGLFKCMFCTYPKIIDEKQQMLRIAETMEVLNRKMDKLEKSITEPHQVRRRSSIHLQPRQGLESLQEEEEDEKSSCLSSESENPSYSTLPVEDVPPVGIYWKDNDEILCNSRLHFLSDDEDTFWKGLIKKYLEPLKKDKKKEERVAIELKELRDKSAFSFFLINAIFVLTLYLLQTNNDITFLNINWPLRGGASATFVYSEASNEIQVSTTHLKLEPIGLLFLASFGIIIFIQFIAMLYHRLGTFLHILSTTHLNCSCTRKVSGSGAEENIQKNLLEFVRETQQLRDVEDEDVKSIAESQFEEMPKVREVDGHIHRRPTIGDLQRKSKLPKRRLSLADTFNDRYLSGPTVEGEIPKVLRRYTNRPETLDALNKRRCSKIADLRRQSFMHETRSSFSSAYSGQESIAEATGPAAVSHMRHPSVMFRDL